jgi:hypothetical protein
VSSMEFGSVTLKINNQHTQTSEWSGNVFDYQNF